MSGELAISQKIAATVWSYTGLAALADAVRIVR